jgi:hypothetical protein
MSQWQLEREASRSFYELQEHAEKCRDLHERANMQLPEPLRRFLGLGAVAEPKAQSSAPAITIPVIPPPTHPRPPIAGDDWVWVELDAVMPTTAVAGVLRDQVQPQRARDVIAAVVRLLPRVSSGSVANLFSRLEGSVLRREDGGWLLINRDVAPVLYEGRFWGPASAFQKQELAAYRRDVIVHLLRQFETGLQTVQIVDQLKRLPWLRAPYNKDLVKEDMKALADDGKVRPRGNTRKWEIAPVRENEGADLLKFMAR